MNPFLATYRVQLRSEFPFSALQARLAYLARLGISTIYASPILASRKGSSHGYDGIDPSLVDPELGGQADWEKLQTELKQQGLTWLQDIVPNHLAYSPENAWLRDIFLLGPLSQYYSYFDVDWEHPNPELSGRLMLPVLGQSIEEVIEAGQISLMWEEDHLALVYFEHRYPMALATYPFVLTQSEAFPWLSKEEGKLQAAIAEKKPSLLRAYQQKITQQYRTDSAFAAYFDAQVERINHNSLDLKQLLDLQFFTFEYWPLTDTIINYRRFFTVNDLICLNMQHEEVFDQYHQWIKQEASQGRIQGLRIDHIDGLQAPGPYLDRVGQMLGNSVGVWVEKILEQEEELPAEWPTAGSTGYEFLSRVNKLLTYGPGLPPMEQLYQSLLGEKQDLTEIIYRNKRLMLHRHLVGEWDNLFRLLNHLDLVPSKVKKDWGDESIRRFIGEFLLAMPVYRIYAQHFPLTGADRDVIEAALKAVAKRKPILAKQVAWFQQRWIENRFDSPAQKEAGLHFLQRMVQFSGPLMAKGLEDTTFYTYLRFLAHNEVGEDPHIFSSSKSQFHAFMRTRAKQGLPMNALSTHDTKRGEDARARLLVLSEMPQAWASKVHTWETIRGQQDLSANDAYLVYQTLLGAWPMDGQVGPSFESRVHAYLEKALREAKVKTQWGNPNSTYEHLAKQLASDFIDPEGPYRSSFEEVFDMLRDHGIINSLSQVLLKNTCPGLPDLYQGCENWNLSLVDPDNRRPVDYEGLEKQMASIDKWNQEKSLLKKLWKHREEGQIKLWLTRASLLARQQFPELFTEGEYIPLEVQGKRAEHLMAYARRCGRQYAVVVLPLYPLTLSQGKAKHLLNLDWGDTQVLLPPLAPHDWQDQLTGHSISTWQHLQLSEVLTQGPWALLTGERPSQPRQAGVLMHISSLPTAYGIGDLGPTAHRFIDWLYETGQQLWQVLPLNSTQGSTDYSPYASDSAMAGNGLFISPELLETEGLLRLEELSGYWLEVEGPVAFAEVETRKKILVDLAFQRFLSRNETDEFEEFCTEQAFWLTDFALYRVIKRQQKGKPWYQWPAKLKRREEERLTKFKQKWAQEIRREQFEQFLFEKQWQKLKAQAKAKGVQLFGDMPIYVSLDSVEVWANPKLFKLNENLEPEWVAGVPPDYFSETGQLWGMPIFDWEKHVETDFQWWIARVKRNLHFFDVLRLDHFRAFADFWEVPAGEKTAIHGRWTPGPGQALFDALKEALGELPLVAEDLGDIDEAVYQLRDQNKLPGMRVLQFAFSPNLPHNLHISHQFTPHSVAYTGTHDNNTLKGWYEHELDESGKQRLEAYLGRRLDPGTLHWAMIRELYRSVAETAIVPMQDILGLGKKAMMNKPGTATGNWRWRMTSWPPTKEVTESLQQLVRMFGR